METVESDDDQITLTWHDFLEPFMLTVPAGSAPGRPHGVYSCFIPSRAGRITVNGEGRRRRGGPRNARRKAEQHRLPRLVGNLGAPVGAGNAGAGTPDMRDVRHHHHPVITQAREHP